jgi:hypothetical protein
MVKPNAQLHHPLQWAKFLLGVFCFLLSAEGVFGQFYQGSNVEFGKNRVQFREFEWFYYPGKNFDVYYYIGGEQQANYTLRACEERIKGLQKFYDYALEDRVQVISYLKQTEFRQSNVGITGDDQFNIGGAARIMGNKMFLYYDGNHHSYNRQIDEALSRLIFTQMMYGGDWKDVVKSSTLLSMPKWYEEGMIRYAVTKGSEEANTFMKDVITKSKFKSMNRLYGREAALGGEAFWSYVAEVYGASVIPSILYMTRVSRNVESGFLFVLGLSMDDLNKDFIRYQKEKYAKQRPEVLPYSLAGDTVKAKKRTMGDLPMRYKKKYVYSQFSLSPDETKLAFVTNEMGQYKIWIYDFEDKKSKRVLKREHRLDRIIDESFPVLAWHPTSQILTYVFEKKGRAFIGNYNVEEKEKTEKELFRIEKVMDMHYSKDGKKIIFSGVNRGHTDLYLYQTIGNNQEQLTNDVYDDVQPSFIDNDQRIIFASNRPDDTLRKDVPVDLFPTENDIYIYNLENRSSVLERITTTKGINETHPAGYSDKHYTYLSDEEGVKNRYIAKIDSTIAAIDTTVHYRYFTSSSLLSSFSRSPTDYEFNGRNGAYTMVFKDRMRPILVMGNKSTDRPLGMSQSSGGSVSSEPLPASSDSTVTRIAPPNIKPEVSIRDYVFEDERKDYAHEKKTVKIQEITADGTTKAPASENKPFELPKSRTYRLNFATDFVLTQVDNSFTSSFYQNYGNRFNRPGTTSNDGPSSINPGVSGLIKIGISDLFEDYKVVGGFRLSGNLQNNDYGLMFENIKSRWDKRITFQRQGQTQVDVENYLRIHTHTLMYQWRYPFNELSSVRFSIIGRQDRGVQLAIDPTSLGERNINQYNLGLKTEYVFDNTISRGVNLFNGTRFKAWYERYQRPDVLDAPSDINVLGFDFRHYKKIHRELIAAFRVAGATSFGEYRIVHYLGGVDNWLFQRIDNSIPIATDQNYIFQSFAGPMRGFYVNSRNGNSFAMANSEIRWPVFKYLLNKPIKSDFIDNFQIVSFFDVGSAWTGKSPYDEENSFNNVVVEKYPVTVTIQNNREPIIYGYGFGLRSRVLGYFLRADWAWGVDDGQTLPRVFYLSLNLDF